MANSEWLLGVSVQHFQNLYNAEIRSSGKYCCCDISYLDVPCVEDLTDLDVTACTSECQPYFEMRFEVCSANGTCSDMRKEDAVIDNTLATYTSPLLVQLVLNSEEFMIENVTNVSVNKQSYCV